MNDFVQKKDLEDIVCIGVQFILDCTVLQFLKVPVEFGHYDPDGFGLVQFNLYL
jgi:hypothetical protein